MAFEDEVESEVRTFAASNFARRTGSGIPDAPKIEVEEVTLEAGPINLKMDKTPDVSQISPAGGGIVPPNRTGACCVGTTCVIASQAHCAAIGGIYHGDGSVCSPSPC